MTQGSSPQTTNWVLEGWRGLASWLVVYTHYWAFGGGDLPFLRFAFTGVDLFFVISGFVFGPYLFGQALNLKAFALRRFFRIYPAYVLALALYVWLKHSEGKELLYVWQHLGFAHLQSSEMAFYYNPPFWSLPSEVEFYLCLPLMAFLTRRYRWGFAGLFASALLLRLAIGWESDRVTQNPAFVWMHHLPGMGLEFLLGAAAWRFSTKPGLAHEPAIRLRQSYVIFGLGAAGWLALANAFGVLGDAGIDLTWARGQTGWLAAGCFAMMVAGSVHFSAHHLTVRSWTARSSIWAGRLSYGVYLFHIAALRLLEPYRTTLDQWPLMGWHGTAALLTLAIAIITYNAWENPWRQFGRSWSGQYTSVSPG